MRESKLVKQIADLPTVEQTKFKLFVQSPFFNQHKKTIKLLDIILKKMNNKRNGLAKERVFKQLFPGEVYDEQQLHNIMSYLKRLFYRFMAVRQFEDHDYTESLYTLEAAYSQNKFDILKNRGKLFSRQLAKVQHHDSQYYHADYRLKALTGYYASQYEDRTKSEVLQQMLDNFDRYYFVEKLKNVCHLMANKIILNTKYDFHLLDEILDHIDNNPDLYINDLAIQMYRTILSSLVEENNPIHYEKIKYMLTNQYDRLVEEEQSNLYIFAYNYCIRQINSGNSAYQRELFNLYKRSLENGLMFTNGVLSEWNYKNITALGCTLGEFEWIEAFIQEYQYKLPEHRRENAYQYNLAYLYYNKKMYHEALSALLVVQFTDVKYHLSTSFLLLRTYYALNDIEALLSLIETFRIYVIRNNKVTTDQKREYTNFLRFAKKLVLLKNRIPTYSRKDREDKVNALIDAITNAENVINRYWLLNECKALA